MIISSDNVAGQNIRERLFLDSWSIAIDTIENFEDLWSDGIAVPIVQTMNIIADELRQVAPHD